MPTTQNDFNNPRLHTLYGSGKVPGELLKGLFRILIDTIPKKIEEIQAALHDKKWEVLVRHPHSLKSSCANLGLERLAGLWKELEFLGKAQDFDTYKQKYPTVEKEMLEALQHLKVATSNFNTWYEDLKK